MSLNFGRNNPVCHAGDFKDEKEINDSDGEKNDDDYLIILNSYNDDGNDSNDKIMIKTMVIMIMILKDNVPWELFLCIHCLFTRKVKWKEMIIFGLHLSF